MVPSPLDRPADPSPAPPGRIVANRYELEEPLGKGGCAEVFAAMDRVTHRRVAVKLIRPDLLLSLPRTRREVLALRLLRVPGVVHLLDEGVDAGSPFLVMDVVPGRPFPGSEDCTAWEVLAPRALALLECVGRIHAAGVVHRDLKPSNVFVDDGGRITILDFGLSWGAPLGEQVTVAGTFVGTPEYLAPELVGMPGGDTRSDLYSVGVMLYGSLGGRLPHEASDLASLIALKQSTAPTPLRWVAPRVPRAVAQAVDRLLAIDPAERPQSAGEAIAALFGGTHGSTPVRTLPRLGGTASLDRVLAALRAGESADVSGPRGSGRSRLLAEAAEHLRSDGRPVHWAVPSDAPYGSLGPVTGPLDDLPVRDAAEVPAAIRARVEAVLRAGAVVVADDPERLDRRSAETLAACRGAGGVLRVVAAPGPDAIAVEPLAEEALRPLFRGPDRIFHFREDGAKELWHRTGGLQSRVASESAAWVRAGLATWDSGRLVVTREALDRLRGGLLLGDESMFRDLPLRPRAAELDEILGWIVIAWPQTSPDLLSAVTRRPLWRIVGEIEDLEAEGAVRRLGDGRVQPLSHSRALQSWRPAQRRAAHIAISRAMPPGEAFRLRHLAAAEETAQVIDEALLRAPALVREGLAGDALIVLEIALTAARAADDAAAEGRVLVAFAVTAHAGGSEPARLRRAVYEIERARERTHRLEAVRAVLGTALDAGRSSPTEVIAALDSVADAVPPEFEVVRQIERGRAGLRLPPAEADAVVEEFSRWASTVRHPGVEAAVCAMDAIRARARGKFEESARLHLRAASLTDRVIGRVAGQANAAIVLLDAGPSHVDDARRIAERGCDDAAASRLPAYEATFWSILREIRYRRDASVEPDRELAAAADQLGEADVAASILLTEAAIAWRAGLSEDAQRWASRAAQLTPRPDASLLARSLSLAAGAPSGETEIEEIRKGLRRVNVDPDVAAQVLGLLALRAADPAPLREEARTRLGGEDWGDREARRTVLSLRECCEETRVRR